MNEKPAIAQKPQTDPSRTPIRIERLIFTSPNAYGVKLPDGDQGTNERVVPFLVAGEHGGVTIAIEHRPWMRVFRVTKTRKVSRTVDKKEVETWEPMGKPFHIPESWAVSVPVED